MAKIDEYKDRMTAPVKFTRIDPKTRKPVATKQTVKKTPQKRK